MWGSSHAEVLKVLSSNYSFGFLVGSWRFLAYIGFLETSLWCSSAFQFHDADQSAVTECVPHECLNWYSVSTHSLSMWYRKYPMWTWEEWFSSVLWKVLIKKHYSNGGLYSAWLVLLADTLWDMVMYAWEIELDMLFGLHWQISGQEEAIFPEFCSNYALWCGRGLHFFCHHLSWCVPSIYLCSSP